MLETDPQQQDSTKPPPNLSPDEFEDWVGQKLGVPRGLRKALAGQESGGEQYNADGSVKTSPKNAQGRYQVLQSTADTHFGKGKYNVADPYDNIYVGLKYLTKQYDSVDPSITEPVARWHAAVAGYHGGESQIEHINKTGGEIANRSDGLITTPRYADNVMSRWQQASRSSGEGATASGARQEPGSLWRQPIGINGKPARRPVQMPGQGDIYGPPVSPEEAAQSAKLATSPEYRQSIQQGVQQEQARKAHLAKPAYRRAYEELKTAGTEAFGKNLVEPISDVAAAYQAQQLGNLEPMKALGSRMVEQTKEAIPRYARNVANIAAQYVSPMAPAETLPPTTADTARQQAAAQAQAEFKRQVEPYNPGAEFIKGRQEQLAQEMEAQKESPTAGVMHGIGGMAPLIAADVLGGPAAAMATMAAPVISGANPVDTAVQMSTLPVAGAVGKLAQGPLRVATENLSAIPRFAARAGGTAAASGAGFAGQSALAEKLATGKVDTEHLPATFAAGAALGVPHALEFGITPAREYRAGEPVSVLWKDQNGQDTPINGTLRTIYRNGEAVVDAGAEGQIRTHVKRLAKPTVDAASQAAPPAPVAPAESVAQSPAPLSPENSAKLQAFAKLAGQPAPEAELPTTPERPGQVGVNDLFPGNAEQPVAATPAARPAIQKDSAGNVIRPVEAKPLTRADRLAQEKQSAYEQQVKQAQESVLSAGERRMAAIKQGDFTTAADIAEGELNTLQGQLTLAKQRKDFAVIQQLTQARNAAERTHVDLLQKAVEQQKQVNAPTAELPSEATPVAKPLASTPLLESVVNPSGGIAQPEAPQSASAKPPTTDFAQLAEQQKLGRSEEGGVRLLSRIQQLGGINPAGMTGELRNAVDKRYPGLINRKSGVKPDELLRQLAVDEQYPLDTSDLNTLWKAIDNDASGKPVYPTTRSRTAEIAAEENAGYEAKQREASAALKEPAATTQPMLAEPSAKLPSPPVIEQPAAPETTRFSSTEQRAQRRDIATSVDKGEQGKLASLARKRYTDAENKPLPALAEHPDLRDYLKLGTMPEYGSTEKGRTTNPEWNSEAQHTLDTLAQDLGGKQRFSQLTPEDHLRIMKEHGPNWSPSLKETYANTLAEHNRYATFREQYVDDPNVQRMNARIQEIYEAGREPSETDLAAFKRQAAAIAASYHYNRADAAKFADEYIKSAVTEYSQTGTSESLPESDVREATTGQPITERPANASPPAPRSGSRNAPATRASEGAANETESATGSSDSRGVQQEAGRVGESVPRETPQSRTVTHDNPDIHGKPIVAETADGRVIVPNEHNKTGVSVVKDQSKPPQFNPGDRVTVNGRDRVAVSHKPGDNAVYVRDPGAPRSDRETAARVDDMKMAEPKPTERYSGLAPQAIEQALSPAADAARVRITQRGGGIASNLPDYAIIGAHKIAKGAADFTDWSNDMVKDFGRAIKPHLEKLWVDAQELHEGLNRGLKDAPQSKANDTQSHRWNDLPPMSLNDLTVTGSDLPHLTEDQYIGLQNLISLRDNQKPLSDRHESEMRQFYQKYVDDQMRYHGVHPNPEYVAEKVRLLEPPPPRPLSREVTEDEYARREQEALDAIPKTTLGKRNPEAGAVSLGGRPAKQKPKEPGILERANRLAELAGPNAWKGGPDPAIRDLTERLEVISQQPITKRNPIAKQIEAMQSLETKMQQRLRLATPTQEVKQAVADIQQRLAQARVSQRPAQLQDVIDGLQKHFQAARQAAAEPVLQDLVDKLNGRLTTDGKEHLDNLMAEGINVAARTNGDPVKTLRSVINKWDFEKRYRNLKTGVVTPEAKKMAARDKTGASVMADILDLQQKLLDGTLKDQKEVSLATRRLLTRMRQLEASSPTSILYSATLANLLTHPTTLVRPFTSSAANSIFNGIGRFTGSMADRVMSKLAQTPEQRTMMMPHFTDMMAASKQAIVNGFKDFGQDLRTGSSELGLAKGERFTMPEAVGKEWASKDLTDFKNLWPAISKTLAAHSQLASRFHKGEHAPAYRGAYVLAKIGEARVYAKQFPKAQEFQKMVEFLEADHPAADLVAKTNAEVSTLYENTGAAQWFGEKLQELQDGKPFLGSEWRTLGKVLNGANKVFNPFTRVAWNKMSRSLEGTGLPLAAKTANIAADKIGIARRAVKSGIPLKDVEGRLRLSPDEQSELSTGVQRATAGMLALGLGIAKGALGAGFGAGLLGAASVTGHRKEDFEEYIKHQKEIKTQQAAGAKPASVQVLGHNIETGYGLEPVAGVFAHGVDIGESLRYGGLKAGAKAAGRALWSIAGDNPLGKVYTGGKEAIAESGGGSSFVKSLPARIVPGEIRGITDMTDREKRKPETVMENFKSVIPGLSKSVPRALVNGQTQQLPYPGDPFKVTPLLNPQLLNEDVLDAAQPKQKGEKPAGRATITRPVAVPTPLTLPRPRQLRPSQ